MLRGPADQGREEEEQHPTRVDPPDARSLGLWDNDHQWPRDTRSLGTRAVTKTGDWETGGAWWGGIASFLTWNIGPLGWAKSVDYLLALLKSRPTVLTLQDARLSKKGIKGGTGMGARERKQIPPVHGRKVRAENG